MIPIFQQEDLESGKLEFFVKYSGHFVQLLKPVNLQSPDTHVSFDVSLFADLPVDEALQIISNKLHIDDTGGMVCLACQSLNGTVGGLFEKDIFPGG
jgi:hypothetical protein